MLTVKVLASGSKGNCYLLTYNNQTLILDCGIGIKEIKKGLDFDVSKVVGVIVSHEHKDHSLSMEDMRNMGIPIFAPYKLGSVKKSHIRMGNFDITTFDLPHDGVWNNGFLIKVGSQKILYMTDFEYCEYVFKKQKVNHILIECNYQSKYVERELVNYEHKVRGHCELNTCRDFIKANATDGLRSVLLLHMGMETCDFEECVTEIEKAVKSDVYVDYARKGLEMELSDNKCPF